VAGRLGGLANRAVGAALRTGMRKGIGDGSRVWFALGAVALGVRLVQRLASPGKPVVVTEQLRVGEALVIRHLSREE
jgi:hypothetical protein